MPKAAPQVMSGAGSHPATSAYHWIICCSVGRPGVAPGRKAGGYRGPVLSNARTYGVVKLAKSESGWPMVAISQLIIQLVRGVPG